MTSNNHKEEIIESLIRHLPQFGESLSALIHLLQNVIGNEEKILGDKTNELLRQFEAVVSSITSIIDEIPFEDGSDFEADYLQLREMYFTSLRTTIKGLTNIALWIKDEEKQDDLLMRSIDSLFLGSQQTMDLVNTILKK